MEKISELAFEREAEGSAECFVKKMAILTLLFLTLAGCRARVSMKHDPFYDTFYEKTRLIMTNEEIGVYKILPDKESKEEFIEEFWKIRDPDPATEENEAKQAFEERVDYANKWFGYLNPQQGREIPRDDKKYGGWKSDPGRIYIILGPPDKLIVGEGFEWMGERDRSILRYSNETWYYYRYDLYLYFSKTGIGEMKLTNWSTVLTDALEDAKLNMMAYSSRKDIKRAFKFKASYEDGQIVIKIPVRRVTFEDEDGKLKSAFKVKINVYRNHRKIDEVEETKTVVGEVGELASKKNILLNLGYTPKENGKYHFDVIVDQLSAISFSKYRSFVKSTIKN